MKGYIFCKNFAVDTIIKQNSNKPFSQLVDFLLYSFISSVFSMAISTEKSVDLFPVWVSIFPHTSTCTTIPLTGSTGV